MSNIINDIAHNYVTTDLDYTDSNIHAKALLLEEALINVCDNLSKINALTHYKKIDISYLLTIVGSYVLGIQEGTLDKETTEPPSRIFADSLYPILDNINTEVVVEEITDDDTSDSTVPIGYDTKDTSD